MCVRRLSRFSTLVPFNRSELNFEHVIWGMRKTDCNDKKSENRKSENRKSRKIEKNGKFQNQNILKSGTNHRANERPKGEFQKYPKSKFGTILKQFSEAI